MIADLLCFFFGHKWRFRPDRCGLLPPVAVWICDRCGDHKFERYYV